MAQGLPAAPRRASLLRWSAAQFAAASAGLVAVLGGGVVRALWRRTFAFGAAASAAAVLALGLTAVGLALLQLGGDGQSPPDALVWGATLATACLAGAAAAQFAPGMAFWELQAVVLAATGVLALLLARPDAGAEPWQLVPGARLFGPLWDRMLGLWAPLAFLAALVGASLRLFTLGLGRGAAGARPGVGLAWRLARRHLAGRSRVLLSGTAAVAVLGIALGVAALVTTTAVMSGYQEDIRSRILGTNAHLVVQKYGIDFTAHAEVVAAAEAVPGVVAGAPFVFNEAMLAGALQGTGVLLKGIDVIRAPAVTDVGRNLCADVVGQGAQAQCVVPPAAEAAADRGQARLARLLQPPAAGTPPPLIVGLSLYRRLGLPLGSQVRLLTPVGMSGARGNAPRRASFVLAGVFASGMHEFDNRLVYTGLAQSQQLLGMGEAVSGVELRLADPDAVERVGRQVLGAVGRYPYRTLDWRQLNAGIFTALTLQKVVMFLVLALIVVVASFNVASTLFLAVAQKARQTSVLKAMGAQEGSVLQTFLLEGWCTGALGCGLGLTLGLGASWALSRLQVAIAADVYMVDAVRIRLSGQELALVALCTLVICHLAALVPALAAARRRRAID